MLKFYKLNIKQLSFEKSLRLDFGYVNESRLQDDDYYCAKDLFEVVPYKRVYLEDIPENFNYAEIGCVSKSGNVTPHKLNKSERNEFNAALFKKIEKGDVIQPDRGNILISTIRPYLNKNILITQDGDYFTKAFLQLKPKIDSKILYYCIRSKFLPLINAASRQGKGYPTLKEDDLENVKFPKAFLDYLLSNREAILERIEVIEKEIEELENDAGTEADIINDVFSSRFNIDIPELKNMEQSKVFKISSSRVGFRNLNVRNSYRWLKIEELQNYLYKNLQCIVKLGDYIVSTNNGWSPVCQDNLDGTPVLGQENISRTGKISLTPSKSTLKTKSNVRNFYINKGDFFVSRGNTVELVGLAAVVEDEVKNEIIYPDLYIRLALNSKVNKKYMALLFNSFIGRTYFKYCSKGKNQTMVKISADEINNFYLPIPEMHVQEKIVKEVEGLLDERVSIENKIKSKRDEISLILLEQGH